MQSTAPKPSSTPKLDRYHRRLVDALDRRDRGRASAEDLALLESVHPACLEGSGIVRHYLRVRERERENVEAGIRRFGREAMHAHTGRSGEVRHLRWLGFDLSRDRRPCAQQQGHAPHAGTNQHHKGSRRSSSSETSGSDPGGEPSGPEPAQGDERVCVGCSTSIAHKAKQARFCTPACETRHRRAEKRLLADRPTQPGNEPAAKAAASTPRRAANPYLESPLHDPWHLKRTKMRAEGLGAIDEGDRPRDRDLAGVAPLPAAAGHIEGQARQSSTRPDERARVEQHPAERVVSASARRRALAERSLREAGAGKRRSPELSVPIVEKPSGRLKGLATVINLPDLLSSRRRHTEMAVAA